MKDKLDHKELEERISTFWEDKGIYKFDENSDKEIYSIDTPPPTISGLIHLGHAFSYSQADFVARYKRMRGFSVFYPMGFDNDGIPTELFVEKLHNTTAEKEGREKFVQLVESETKNFEDMYRGVWRSMGISVDWSLLYTTIGKKAQKTSQLSFLELNRMGRAYRKELPTIWCPKEGTALSQMELKDKPFKSKFLTVKFSDEVTIATTRPELMPACVAIITNPADERNKHLIGKTVKVPIFGQEVKVIGDSRVDPTKGTGVVMCCTFGDLTDIEWYKAYNLELRIVIDKHGRMLPEYFKGKKIREAREFITKDLESRGYVLAEKEVEHNVNVHERCNTEIEFLVKKQWFIKYLDMKDELLALGKKLNWHPEYMIVRYENWVKGLQWDWSISRQRYYGIPFPVWYCKVCDEPIFADEKDLPVNPLTDSPKTACTKCGGNEFVPEQDILDTWATSSLTPLINANWATDKKGMGKVYPMSLRPQAHDIISFWLFTTVVKSYLHTKTLPWKDVLISGHGLDSKGMPMHKSAGNIIEPKAVIERFGADPLRHWASISRLGDDASFQEKDVMTGAKIVNKLYNIAKFAEMNRKIDPTESTNPIDRWITARLLVTIKNATEMFDEYNYAGAKRQIDDFFWFFCDNYVEFIKYRIYNKDKTDTSANRTLNETFLAIVKMLAPFMPYITEEIYLELYSKSDGARSVHLSSWPSIGDRKIDAEALARGDEAWRTIVFIRQWKHENKKALNSEIQELTISKDLGNLAMDIKGAMNIKSIRVAPGPMKVPETDISLGIRC